MRINYSSSYLGKIIFIFIGSVIGTVSLVYSNYIAAELAAKERNEIHLWSQALAQQNMSVERSQAIIDMTSSSTTIPYIVVNEYMQVMGSQNVDPEVLADPIRLRERLEKMTLDGRAPIPIRLSSLTLTFFYDESPLLRSLFWFPYIQLGIIGVFIAFAMMTFRSTKQSEQNKVWVGMSKETAHQLGTPTSSLLGWVEYLRTQELPQEVVDEIGRDVTRLTKVVDRFSKIGSTTQLIPINIYDITLSVVSYFQSRIPRHVSLKMDEISSAPLQVLANNSLLEWVFENLLKNALDALGGKGTIEVKISSAGHWVTVDVTDTGKGIAKGSWRRIFHPGFTTKTRGWGLGLSLSKRIVEQYHYGKIFVLNSEIDKGTTIRVQLKKL
ncbi:MAG: HAMP domain-containing sensor histidine kinase [Mucinivorans sp.]